LEKTKQPLKIKWSRSFVGVPSSCSVSKTKTGKNDRDLNASRNIHIEGLRLLAT